MMRNEAGDVGGGIFIGDGSLDLRRSVVNGNRSGGEGGGIFVPDDAGFVITESTLAGNEADEGGGIYTASEVLNNQIVGSTVARNVVTEEGGGVFSDGPSLLVQNSTIADNTADASGGGIYAAPDSGTVLFNATIARNRADADDLGPHGGGGAFVDGGDDFLQSINTLYARNRSTGGVFQDCDAPAPVGIFSSGATWSRPSRIAHSSITSRTSSTISRGSERLQATAVPPTPSSSRRAARRSIRPTRWRWWKSISAASSARTPTSAPTSAGS